MCKDELLGPGDCGLFENWLAIVRSRDGYIRIRDGLVLEGEVQEMDDKEKLYNKGPYKARVHGFFSGVPPGGHLSLVALIPSNGLGASLQV